MQNLSNIPVMQIVTDLISGLLHDHFHHKERFEQFPKFRSAKSTIFPEDLKTRIKIIFDHSNKELSMIIPEKYDISTFIFNQDQFNNFIRNTYENVAIDILRSKAQEKEYENYYREIKTTDRILRNIDRDEIKTGLFEHWENLDQRVYIESTPQNEANPIYQEWMNSSLYDDDDGIVDMMRENIYQHSRKTFEYQICENFNIQSNQIPTATEARQRNIYGDQIIVNEMRAMGRDLEHYRNLRMIDEPYISTFNSKEIPTKKKAKLKADELLKNNLSSKQLYEYQTKKEFSVFGGTTKNLYTIKHGTQINVIDHVNNRKLCFLPKGCRLPGDVMLAQKMSLENDEMNSLKIAHEWNI